MRIATLLVTLFLLAGFDPARANSDLSIEATVRPGPNMALNTPFTLSFTVTNHGPDPAEPYLVGGDFRATRLFSNATCFTLITYVDSDEGFWGWGWSNRIGTLQPGQSVSCEMELAGIQFEFTENVTIQTGLADPSADPDVSNNGKRLALRGLVFEHPIPTASSLGFIVLAMLVVFIAWTKLGLSRRTLGISALLLCGHVSASPSLILTWSSASGELAPSKWSVIGGSGTVG